MHPVPHPRIAAYTTTALRINCQADVFELTCGSRWSTVEAWDMAARQEAEGGMDGRRLASEADGVGLLIASGVIPPTASSQRHGGRPSPSERGEITGLFDFIYDCQA